MKQFLLGVLCLFFIAESVYAAQHVNVYSGRKEELIKPVLDAFTRDTGIQVNLITGKADALIKRLEIEGDASPADLLITVDAGRLYRAKSASLLQSISSELIDERVSASLRDTDGQWVALSSRLRPIFYDANKVSVDQLSTYEDLADSKWQGKICIRSSNNIYNQSLVASMLEARGGEQTQQWLNGLVKNFARSPAGGDTDQLRAVAAGICSIAIANTYYYGRLIKSDKPEDKAVVEAVKLFWPNQAEGQRGTHINVSGAGVTKFAPNREAAIELLEYLVSDQSQQWYAEANNEYPVVSAASVPETLAALGQFKSDSLSLSKLGENNRQALLMMDKAGWK